MLLKNTNARLITIRTAEKSYQVLPGNNPDTEVPLDACQSDFVKALIANGDLIVTSDDEPTSEFDGMTKKDLLALCEVESIETNSRDTVDDLIAKLDAAE